MCNEEKIKLAEQRLTAKGCQVYHAASSQEVENILQGLCQPGDSVLCTAAEELEQIGLTGMLNRLQLDWQSTRQLGREDKQRLLTKANGTQWGITDADAILVDTGTLVLAENHGDGRIVSNIPAQHIAIVPVHKLYEDGESGLLAIPPASYYSLITGPSRTGDIEGDIVCGMHGPLAVHVILLRSAV